MQRCLFLFLFFSIYIAGTSAQTIYTWQTGGTPSWNDPNRWSISGGGNGVPNSATAVAVIDSNSGASSTVELYSINPTVGSLTVNSGDRLVSTASLTVSADGFLGAGSVTNNGDITLLTGGSLLFSSAAVATGTLQGSGSVTLSGGALSTSSGFSLTSVTLQTIAGAGTISGAVTNDGVIRGNASSQTLKIQGNGVVNRNLIESTSNGTVRVEGSLQQTSAGKLKNTDGYVTLANGSKVVGGTLETVSYRMITTDSAQTGAVNTLSDVTISAGSNYGIGGNNTTRFERTTTNNGLIGVIDNGIALFVRDGSTDPVLTGSGQLNLMYPDAVLDTAADATLTNASGHSIIGGGIVRGNILNDGIIRPYTSSFSAPTLKLQGTGIVNRNLITADTYSYLRVEGTLQQTAAGKLRNSDGYVILANGSKVIGGTLESVGYRMITSDYAQTGAVNTLSDVTVSAGSSYGIGNNTTTRFERTTTNNGVISVVDNGVALFVRDGTTDPVLTGSGQLNLMFPDAVVDTAADATLTNASGHSIIGTGIVRGNILNDGIIRPYTGSFSAPTLKLQGTGIVNRNLITADTYSYLRVEGTLQQTAAGKLRNSDGYVILANGSKVIGGTLESVGYRMITTDYAQTGAVNTLSDVAISTGSSYGIGNNTTTRFERTTTNNGVISVVDNGVALFVRDGTTDPVLTGSGQLNLMFPDAVVDTAADATLTNASGHSIIGAGIVRGNILNDGIIRPYTGSFSAPTLKLQGTGIVNRNLITADTYSYLRVEGTLQQTAAGKLRNSDGNVLLANSSKVVGGTLETVGYRLIETDYNQTGAVNTLSDVTVAAGSNYGINSNNTTRFEKVTTNNGSIHLVDNATARFVKSGAMDPTLQGSGTLLLRKENTARAEVESGATLIQAAQHTIEGEGVLSGAVNNAGTIHANVTGKKLIVQGTLSNSGTLKVSNDGILQIDANTVNTGVFLAAKGTLIVNGALTQLGEVRVLSGATIQFNNAVTIEAGTLGGNGTYAAPNGLTLGDDATLSPGNSPGTVYVDGSLSLSSGTEILFELADPEVIGGGINDLVVVDGDLNLEGNLSLAALAGFEAGTYRLFDYSGSLLAQNLQLTLGPSGYNCVVDYSTPQQVNVVVTAVPEPRVLLFLGLATLVAVLRRQR